MHTPGLTSSKWLSTIAMSNKVTNEKKLKINKHLKQLVIRCNININPAANRIRRLTVGERISDGVSFHTLTILMF